MDNSNLNLLIAFLLFGLKRYLRCSVPLSPQVRENVDNIIKSPFFNEQRDVGLVASQITTSPEFLLEVCIQTALLLTASYFFIQGIRGLEQGALATPQPHAQTSPSHTGARPNPLPTENETRPTTLSRNPAGFFSRDASHNQINDSENSESEASDAKEANSLRFKKA